MTEALSEYRTGDIVTLLKDKTLGAKTITPGTTMRISRIKPRVDYEMLTEDLEFYIKKSKNFLYVE